MNALVFLGIALGGNFPLGPHAAVIDTSIFRVYQHERAIGTETFSFESMGDSLRIFSHVVETLPGPDSTADLPIDKVVVLFVNRLDYDLLWYQSTFKGGGKDLTWGLVVGDTAFTAYCEEHGGRGVGFGDRYERPAGRLFVLDGQVFMLFDVMCRNLNGRTFDSRPLSVILLRDDKQVQVTSITATDLGTETIRWGARPVAARKLRFGDSYATFDAWVGPQGYMLRLEQAATGLRVEREPPAVKPAARRAPRPSGG
ncbi:MAG TPA: hypothetical protein VGK89_01345 [Candidatus Eisenbacteria bacterium]